MAIMLLLMLLGLVTMLGLVEVGYLYWAKRDTQKVADLAALAGVTRIDTCASGNGDNSAARENANTDNGFANHGTLQIVCGIWDPTGVPAGDHYRAAASGEAPNAVKVIAQRPVLPFLGVQSSLPTVTAHAVASVSSPITVFSVGSQLLRFNNNTPLGTTLGLVGVNLDQATLVGYNGLANITITPAGLLQALGIPVDANISAGDLNALLVANNVTLGKLLDLSATVISQAGSSINLSALNTALAQLSLNQVNLQLGSTDAVSGLFAQIITPDGSGANALTAKVDLLDLLNTAIGIGTKGHAATVNNLSLGGGLITVQSSVIEPASIGIGGVGTHAYNAQVRLYINIDTDQTLGGVLRPLLNLLGTRVYLPIYVDVVNAMGTVTKIDCDQATPTATIQVNANVADICIGKVDPSVKYSTLNVCETSLANEQLVTLLGKSVLNTQIHIPALTQQDSLTLAAGETGSTRVNALALGNTAEALTDSLFGVLGSLFNPAASSSSAASQLATTFLANSADSSGRYNVAQAINLLKNGSTAQQISALGDWQLTNGVPYPCPPLGLTTCWKTGSVWDAFQATTSGNTGLLSSVAGALLGGLLVNDCRGLVSNLLNYNGCIQQNLTSYLQTAPNGLLDSYAGSGSATDPSTNNVVCNGGLLCILLKPVVALLKPLLNGVGGLLSTTLTNVLGLEIGRTDVAVQSIQCHPARLVY